MDEAGGGEAAASSAFCRPPPKSASRLEDDERCRKKAAAIGPGATLEERLEKRAPTMLEAGLKFEGVVSSTTRTKEYRVGRELL
jgi:hypothetical protein